MPMIFRCPHGCKTQYPIETLRGWKKHMTAKHGRYSDEELEAASRGDNVDDVASRMADFANSLDGTPVEVNKDGSISEIPQTSTDTPAVSSQPETRKVRATPRSLTDFLSGIPEKLLEALDVTPDTKDRKALEEASEFLQDVFGVNFEVDESKTTIRSKWGAFAWVGGIIALIFIKHKASYLLKYVGFQREEPPAGDLPIN